MTATATGMDLAIPITTTALTPTSPPGSQRQEHDHHHGGHGHSHGLVDESIKRSREGLRAVGLSLAILALAAISRLIHPQTPSHLLALAAAGLIGFGGNWIAAQIRTRAGNRLDSPALIADGNHARADSYVSLAVVASAAVVAVGLPIADPLIGLATTAVILKITWDSWRTVRHSHSHSH